MSIKTSEKQVGPSSTPASIKTAYFSAKQKLPTAQFQEQGVLTNLDASIRTMESGGSSMVRLQLSQGNDDGLVRCRHSCSFGCGESWKCHLLNSWHPIRGSSDSTKFHAFFAVLMESIEFAKGNHGRSEFLEVSSTS